jgi:hypothetical protein
MGQENINNAEQGNQNKNNHGIQPPQKSEYNLLYKLGAMSAIIAGMILLFEILFIRLNYYPASVEQWYDMFNRSRILGLFYLNAMDIISVLLLGVMFAALCTRLKDDGKTAVRLSLPFAFLGIALFIIPRTIMLSFVSLSGEYAAAGQTSKDVMLAAGKILSSLAMPTMQTTGFFIIALVSYMLSMTMINSYSMPKAAGFVGIMAFFLTLIDNITFAIAPGIANLLMQVAGVFWVVWLIIVGAGLFMARD